MSDTPTENMSAQSKTKFSALAAMMMESRAMIFVLMTVMISSIGFGIIIPIMPDLLKEISGLANHEAAVFSGWLTLVFAIAQFICMPIAGALSDSFGRRPVMLVSLFGLSFDYLILALAPTMIWLFVARCIAGMFSATFATANAYIADISPPEKRAQNFGLIGAFFGVGFMIGPVIGGLVGEYFGTRAPFFAAAAFSALNFIFGFFVLPETLKPEDRRKFSWKRATPVGALGQIAKIKNAKGLLFIMFLLATAHTAYPTVFAFIMNESLGWSSGDIGWSLFAFAVGSIIVQGWLIRIIIPKVGLFWAALIGITSNMLGFIGFGFASAGWVIYVMGACSAFAGLYQPSLNNMISTRLNASEQGELSGAIGAIQGLALIAGPIPMVFIFNKFSQPRPSDTLYMPGMSFIFAGLLSLAALVIFLMITTKADRNARFETTPKS